MFVVFCVIEHVANDFLVWFCVLKNKIKHFGCFELSKWTYNVDLYFRRTDQIEMCLFVLRYISCLTIFVLGLKAPGIMQNVDYFSLNDSTRNVNQHVSFIFIMLPSGFCLCETLNSYVLLFFLLLHGQNSEFHLFLFIFPFETLFHWCNTF